MRGRRILEALEQLVGRGGDADDVLREVVRVLAERYAYVAIKFVEGDDLLPGPAAGTPDEAATAWPITFQGMTVAQLEVSPFAAEDRDFLERVTTILSPYASSAGTPAGALDSLPPAVEVAAATRSPVLSATGRRRRTLSPVFSL